MVGRAAVAVGQMGQDKEATPPKLHRKVEMAMDFLGRPTLQVTEEEEEEPAEPLPAAMAAREEQAPLQEVLWFTAAGAGEPVIWVRLA